eukprot:SAG11_NODE_26756_length_341_cov_0.842975_1_plen_99_part_01
MWRCVRDEIRFQHLIRNIVQFFLGCIVVATLFSVAKIFFYAAADVSTCESYLAVLVTYLCLDVIVTLFRKFDHADVCGRKSKVEDRLLEDSTHFLAHNR